MKLELSPLSLHSLHLTLSGSLWMLEGDDILRSAFSRPLVEAMQGGRWPRTPVRGI